MQCGLSLLWDHQGLWASPMRDLEDIRSSHKIRFRVSSRLDCRRWGQREVLPEALSKTLSIRLSRLTSSNSSSCRRTSSRTNRQTLPKVKLSEDHSTSFQQLWETERSRLLGLKAKRSGLEQMIPEPKNWTTYTITSPITSETMRLILALA